LISKEERLKILQEANMAEATTAFNCRTNSFEGENKLRPYLTIRMDITNRCNLKCIMCHFADDAFEQKPARNVTADDLRKMLDGLSPFLHTIVLSCGREPLISPHLPDILSYLSSAHSGIDIEICTNAMLLDDSVRRLMIEHGVTALMASIDAVGRKELESIRIGAKYDRVMSNVLSLTRLKKAVRSPLPIVIFNYVMMNRNIHEAPYFLHIAQKSGCSMVDFHHAAPGCEHFPFEEMLDRRPEKYNYYQRLIASEAARRKLTIFLPPPFEMPDNYDPRIDPEVRMDDFLSIAPCDPSPPLPIPKKFPRNFRPRNFDETIVAQLEGRAICKRPFTEIMIRDQEEILPCPWYKTPLGLISSGQSLQEIFFGERFSFLRQAMLAGRQDAGCAGCPINGHLLSARAL
jgi:MoaA/NifB/PqqE/SkfB family radical SAM enzyme